MWYGCSGWPRDLWELSHCWNGDCKRGSVGVFDQLFLKLPQTHLFFAGDDRKCDSTSANFCGCRSSVYRLG